mgnify:CR=1 FL=1
MGTRSIISVDKKTELGIYKNSDGYPSSTIPSILTYITIFGFIAFKKEIQRIAEKGGCSSFYYVHVIKEDEYKNSFEVMLRTKQLSTDTFEANFNMENVKSHEYGYLVSNNEIIIYHHGDLEKIIKFSTKMLKKLIIEGIFRNDIEKPFIKKFKLK